MESSTSVATRTRSKRLIMLYETMKKTKKGHDDDLNFLREHRKYSKSSEDESAEFRNKKTRYDIKKVETTKSVRKSGFRNRYIMKKDQSKSESKNEAGFRKGHHISAEKRREYRNEMNEYEDVDEIKIKESSSSARSRIRKGKQPAYNDGCPRSYTSTKLKSHNRKSDHKGLLRSPRTRLRSGAVEKPSKVTEITSDSSSSDGGLSDSTTSEYDGSDDSLFEVEKLDSKEVSSSSAESDEEDYIPEEKSEEGINETKDLMEFSDSNNDDDQESVHQGISKKLGLFSSKTSLDASSKVVWDIHEKNERAKHVQESVTKGKRKDEEHVVADAKRFKKVVSSNEIDRKMEKQREEERNLTTIKKAKGGAIRNGKKKVDVEKDSGIMHQSRGSIPIKEHTRREEVNAEFEEIEQPPTKGVHIRTDNHFCKNLLDSVLGKNDDEDKDREEANPSFMLPSKFSFEDEVPKPVEKSEYEIMIDHLFAEMDFCLTLGETGSSACQEADKPYRREQRRWFYDSEKRVQKDGYIFLSGESSGSYFNHGGNGTTVWDDIKHSIQQTLFDHQREGFEFLWRNIAGTTELSEITTMSDSTKGGGCIISHAPGTGKSRLTILFIETYLNRFPHCRPLIIAPACMLRTWEEEFKKWDVDFPFLNLNSDKIPDEFKMALQHIPREQKQKKDAIRALKIYSWNKGKSILGISYNLFGMLVREKEEPNLGLRKILLEKPGLVVLDEGHIPRTRGTNIWQALSKLKTEKRIILSGTPFQNNFEELFNVLQLARPSVVKEKRFNEIFASKRRQLKQKNNIDNDIEELKTAILPFVHVYKVTILQESTPGVIDCVVLLKPLPLQKSLIEKIESWRGIKDDSKMACISTHPYLFRKCKLTKNEKYGVDLAALDTTRFEPNQGVKTRFIMELVRLSVARNEKVLVFSKFLEPLNLIKEHLERRFRWAESRQILMMIGKVDQKNRQDSIGLFNDPKSEGKVLLASTTCSAVGINLVGASRVVLLDFVWNPSVEKQAIGRAYRLGQKKMVYTYHLMAIGTSEGEKLRQQTEKDHLSEKVFASSSNEKAKNLDTGKDDVLEHMVADVKFKDFFEKVIYQPKEKNLIDFFGLEA
ncbi:hypothetical protein ACJIZ3_011455 [Penstemon smallii]|uniref:Uncharacterized protein n=1 Tax=Penstemon smallii TaxID=265156 RepID=A0ABD3UNG4_9LAMI